MADRLFQHIERLHGSPDWGRVLDAGTGRHSLEWIAGLRTSGWTAVTGDSARAEKLQRRWRKTMRSVDRIVAGNWIDPAFLHGETYDVVLADYLLGAIDGFAPYFQSQLFRRLRPHVGRELYVVGLEPYEMLADSAAGSIVREIARLRDASILLAGDRCYREYPRDWTVARIEEAGYAVEDVTSFAIRYGEEFVEGQLRVCESKLDRIGSRSLARGLRDRIADVRSRALGYARAHGGIHFGEDYVIYARRTPASETD